ncbi:DNA internalization-related competence protein ComEC/Rec2 [Aliikangiella maris]|uniref:DNA internalization-related competence protein ComEC/Rec2 n=2 Tax=Aliikangiella maris TaxID=3162458 RepID=A0ABV3MKU2_9GAMM
MLTQGMGLLIGLLSLWFIPHAQFALILLLVSLGILLCRKWFKFSCLFNWVNWGIIWACLNILVWANTTKSLITDAATVEVEGMICSIPYRQAERILFDFCVSYINGQEVGWLSQRKFQASWWHVEDALVSEKSAIHAGETWVLYGRIKPARGRVNPAGFDRERWLLANHYLGQLSVKRWTGFRDLSSISSLYHQMRQSVYEKVRFVLKDSEFQGVILAILMGERQHFSNQQQDVFQRSGTAHLLAISGLHIGIAALWVYWGFLFICKRTAKFCLLIPACRAAEIGALCGALFLLLLSGMAIPACRATLMLSVVFVSRWFGSYLPIANVLSLVMLITLIIFPFSILLASFWLSFGTVSMIALVLNKPSYFREKLVLWFRINWFLFLMLIPVSWVIFGYVSWVAFAVNLLLIPVYSFVITPLIYLAGILAFIEINMAKWLFDWISELIGIGFIIQSKSVEYNQLIPEVSFNPLSLLYVGSLLTISLLPYKLLNLKLKILFLIGFLLSMPFQQKRPYDFQMWVFDIGQGLAVYIETPDGNLIFDTGWGNKQFNLAKTTIIPFLQNNKIRQVDKLIVSHDDSDHSGGVSELLSQVNITQVLSGESILFSHADNCHRATSWQWGRVEFEFLSTDNVLWKSGNNASCVLSVKVGQQHILLTGDIEKQSEAYLIQQGLKPHDFLLAPHHGSLTSSSRQFVNHVRPKYVIFSTGYDNRWKFPKTEVVERYRLIGSEIYNTADDGAVWLYAKPDEQINIASFRRLYPQFWR